MFLSPNHSSIYLQTVTPIVEQHQTARKLVTDEVLDKYFALRELKFGS